MYESKGNGCMVPLECLSVESAMVGIVCRSMVQYIFPGTAKREQDDGSRTNCHNSTSGKGVEYAAVLQSQGTPCVRRVLLQTPHGDQRCNFTDYGDLSAPVRQMTLEASGQWALPVLGRGGGPSGATRVVLASHSEGQTGE